jgi:hypothetical protein
VAVDLSQRRLLADIPARGRSALAERLVMLYDGAKISAQFGRGHRAASAAGRAAEQLVVSWA